MKKVLAWLGGIIVAVVTYFTLAFLLQKHTATAESIVIGSLPKDVGIATEDYKSRVAEKTLALQNAKADEIAAKFKSAFGG
jgi:hypothetical protein